LVEDLGLWNVQTHRLAGRLTYRGFGESAPNEGEATEISIARRVLCILLPQ
jgi:hypothetical protein